MLLLDHEHVPETFQATLLLDRADPIRSLKDEPGLDDLEDTAEPNLDTVGRLEGGLDDEGRLG